MPCSKRPKIPESFFRNFRHVCPRRTRKKKKLNPKLNYFKSLCRNSKCLIHGSECPMEIKNSKKNKTAQINLSHVLRAGDDFEEETNSSPNIDLAMFIKIESSVEDFDAISDSYFKNLVGYKQIKDIIDKTIIWPLKKPEIFKGLREAPKGILLFGPPGTGKTSLGKFIAFKTKSTFFNISASTLSSKWMGEIGKLVRTLFLVAKARQPSIIFMDEIDSILSKRTNKENESTKRLKNEFLFCMSTMDSSQENRVIVIGATSRPQDLDETIRPKFLKRIYIPLPNENDRKEILSKLLEYECHSIEECQINDIVRRTNGYSVVDLKNLSQEAAMNPVNEFHGSAINNLKRNKIRPISEEDFHCALKLIKPTVSGEQVKACETWDFLYGYGGEENLH